MISRYTYSADSVKRAVVDSNGNGKYYVGPFARFQRTDGAFNSIDPLVERYYSISPYAYCAGNPVNLADPNGEKAMVHIDSKDNQVIVRANIYLNSTDYSKTELTNIAKQST